MSYFVLHSLLVSFSRLNTSIGEEGAVFSAIDYSYCCCLCSEECPFLWVLWKGCVI